MTETDELKELIASATAGKAQVEIVEFNDPNFSEPIYLTGQLNDGSEFTFEGSGKTATYAPMKLSKPSSGKMMLEKRTLSLSNVNDLIYEKESQIPYGATTKPTVRVMTYISDIDGNLTDIQAGPFNYYANDLSYDDMSCTINLSTTPVNDNMTGDQITVERFPGLSIL